MKLTTKQRLFADEYIKSGNATEAYIKAGYSVKTNSSAKAASSRLLTNVNLKHYIDAKMAEIESHKIADAKEVLQFYARVLREEETEEVALPVGDGVVTVEKKLSLKDRITVAKEILKRYPLADP
ncbi:terminase small subunit [Lactobacillus alvi]|uniref:Terminase small subunit n=1 Tax=Limosilactobacillus alvi TaxID=990412 RepID=A0ABS2EMY7_9LACO|nr:terminase small subunit [Limosilactobacillus alvi]